MTILPFELPKRVNSHLPLERHLLLSLLFSIFSIIANAQSQKDASVALQEPGIVYESPMVYELMHIAFALTDTNIYAGNVNLYFNNIDTSGTYYREVIKYFGPYKNHTLIKLLNKKLRKKSVSYMTNLSKAYNSTWTNDKVKKGHHFPFWVHWYFATAGVNKRVIKNFAQQTNFAAFYQQHKNEYQKGLEIAKQQLNASHIKFWLEDEFPARYDQYRIIISPLMDSWHFTQHSRVKKQKSAFMWVSGAQGFDRNRLTETQIAGIYTGVVFTEIDHNYVNPISDLYHKQLDTLMGGTHRAYWVKEEGDSRLYTNGYKVFNEYMTHAVYLVYTSTRYNEADQKVIEQSRIRMMVKSRKYSQFESFYRELKRLYDQRNPGQKIPDLYPQILQWVQKQNK